MKAKRENLVQEHEKRIATDAKERFKSFFSYLVFFSTINTLFNHQITKLIIIQNMVFKNIIIKSFEIFQ